jgi:hypothetical protein
MTFGSTNLPPMYMTARRENDENNPQAKATAVTINKIFEAWRG